MSDQKYIVSLRADFSRLRKDLIAAKQLAKSTKIDELTIKARLDRKRLVAELAELRKTIRSFASESTPTIKLRIDDKLARQRIAELSRSSTLRTSRVLTTPQRAAQTATAVTPRIPPLMRRETLTADTSAASRSITKLRADARQPISIPVTADTSIAKRELQSLDRLASRPRSRALPMPHRTRPTTPVAQTPIMRRDPISIRANTDSFRQSITNLRHVETTHPIKIPVVGELNQIRRSLSAIRRDAAKVRGVTMPVTFKRAPGNQFFLRRMATDIATVRATVTPRVNGRPFSTAMGAIRSQSRALARTRPTITPRANTRDAMAHIRSLMAMMDRMASTNIDITPRGFFGGRAAMAAMGAFAGAGSLGGGAAMLAGAGAVGAGAAYGKVASDGVQGLAGLERSQGNLEIVLKDPGKAKDLIEELLELDLQLPVDLGLLTDAASKLAGAGFDSSEIKGDIEAILDAASVSVDGVAVGTERLVRAFSQIRGAGRLLTEDLNQIQEVAPVRKIISDRFGMSANEVAEKSQAGEKGFDVDTILNEILAGFKENYGGSLQKQSEQFYGQLDGLSDRYKQLSKTVAEPIFAPLSQALKNLNEAIDSDSFDQLTAALVGVSEAVGPFIVQLGLAAKLAIKGAGGALNAGKAASIGVAGAAASAVTKGASIVGSAQRLFGKADAASGGLLSGAAGLAGDAVDAIMPGKAAADAIVGAGASAVDTATQYVVDNQPERKPKPAPPKPSITDGLATFGGDIAGQIGDTFNMFSTMADSLGTSLADRAGTFAKQNGIDPTRIGDDITSTAMDLRRGDAQREKDDVVKADGDKRFDKTVADLPTMIRDFANSTFDDPKLADAFKRSTFSVTQERDEDGRMMPNVALKELAELNSRGSVERTDFSGLNSMVQSSVDNQRQMELAQKRNSLAEAANEFLKTIAEKVGKDAPREAVVGNG